MFKVCLLFGIVFLFFQPIVGGWVPRPASFASKPNWSVFDGKNWNDPIEFDWSYTSSDGSVTSLHYEFTQSTPIVIMDIDDQIEELNCDDNSWDGNYYVVVKSPVNINQNYTESSLLVGSKEWGCRDRNGVVAPFYRFIWYTKPYTDGPCSERRGKLCYKLSLWIGHPLAAFDHLEISLNSTQVTDPQEWLNALNNYSPNSQSTPKEKVDGWSETWSWNYNNATGQALNPLIPLYNGPHLTIDCHDCYAMLSLEVNIDLVSDFQMAKGKPMSDIGFHTPSLHPFSIGVKGDFAVHFDWEANASYKITLDKDLTLFTLNIAQLYFFIGLIPIEIDVDLQLVVEVGAYFDANVDISVNFNLTGEVDGGLSYNTITKQWIPWGSRNIQAASFDPSISDHVVADALIAIGPRVVFSFYGIGGPWIGFMPGREAELTIDNLKFCWYLYHIFLVELGAELTWPFDISTKPLDIIHDRVVTQTNCPSIIFDKIQQRILDG